MKPFIKLFAIAFLLPLLSSAQSNYKPGYVVTVKGDTLRGFIDYKEWSSNPTAISFKTTFADSKAQSFTPEGIVFFNINDLDAYRRYAGPISMDVIDKDQTGYAKDTSFRTATVFFKVLQKGEKLILYSYADDLKTRFYVAESQDYRPVELGFRIYYDANASGDGKKTVIENTYMKQLFALANKYQMLDSGLQWDIEHAGYNSDNILEIVSKINHISKAEYKKSNALKGPAANFFFGAAVNVNNASSATGSPYNAGGGTSYTSYMPAVSFGVNIFADRSTRKLQFGIEAGFAQSQFKSSYMLKVYPYIPFRASYDEMAFSVAPRVIYNFYNAENLKIYFGGGIAFSYYKFSNSYLGSQSQPNSATDIQTNNPYFFHTFDNSFMLKAGVQVYKNWGIFAQYLSSVAVTGNGYYQMSSTCEQIGLNYYFQ